MADPIDLRDPEHQDRPLSSFKQGQEITGRNGTDTVWRVVRPGVLKRLRPDPDE